MSEPCTETLNDLGGWRYTDKYYRSEKEAWVDNVYGKIDRDNIRFGLGNVIGYDVAGAIRTWLAENGCSQLSVCEAILLKDEMRPLRQHVDKAKVFWSHMQQEPFLGDAMSELRRNRVDMRFRAQLKAPKVPASTTGLMREVFHSDGTVPYFLTNATRMQLYDEDGTTQRKKTVLSGTTKEELNEAANRCPIWLDYTSLRQCVSDFMRWCSAHWHCIPQ
jgi:hypothetical protein